MDKARVLLFRITISSVLILMTLQLTYELILKNFEFTKKTIALLIFDPENFSYIERFFVIALEISILTFALKSLSQQNFSKTGLLSLALFGCLTIILILSLFL